MTNNELKKLDDCINRAIIDLRGEFQDKDLFDYCTVNDIAITPEQAQEYLVYSRIDKQKSKWRREKPNKNGSLWGDEYLERLLCKGDVSVKVGDATWHWHIEQRTDHLDALSRSQSKFDIDERRRSKLGEIMATNPSITTREAMLQLSLFDEDEAAQK